ncbi:hypothetical protein TRAPUB_13672, partial [Trametes pubescens]
NDFQFGKDAQAKADEILDDGQFAPGYKRTYWEGCTHGSAVRGDIVRALGAGSVARLLTVYPFAERPEDQAGKEGAFKATVEFLIKHL